MNLWIRSQDKNKLIKIDGIALTPSEISIYAINDKGILGTYSSKKRALEVLSDIQNIINAKTIIKFKEFVPKEHLQRVKDAIDKNSIIELPSYEIKELAGVIVYEMPKE